jgi:lipopolysaccharide transport system permease protein
MDTDLVTVISARRGLFDLNIRRLWRYRDLLLLFARRDIKVRYTQTVLGPAWLIIQPLTLTAVFTAIVSGVAQISTAGQPPPIFYLTALIIWSYFSQIVQTVTYTFLTNADLFSKVYFPRIIVPLSALLSNGVALLIQVAVVLVVVIAYQFAGAIDGLSWRIIVFPFVVLQLAAFSLAVGVIFGASTAKYRDISQTTSFLLQIWMFVTPIIYPFSAVAPGYRLLMCFLNPLATIVEASRWCFLNGSLLDVNEIIASVVMTMLLLGVGLFAYQRVERTAMDTI